MVGQDAHQVEDLAAKEDSWSLGWLAPAQFATSSLHMVNCMILHGEAAVSKVLWTGPASQLAVAVFLDQRASIKLALHVSFIPPVPLGEWREAGANSGATAAVCTCVGPQPSATAPTRRHITHLFVHGLNHKEEAWGFGRTSQSRSGQPACLD